MPKYSLKKLNKMVEELKEGGSLDLSSLTSIPRGRTAGFELYFQNESRQI